MVVFCVETKKDKLVKEFMKETHARMSENFIFKKESFALILNEKDSYLLIINFDTFILSFPRRFYFMIMKHGLRKKGYKEQVTLANNSKVLLKLAKVFKNLPRRNNPMA